MPVSCPGQAASTQALGPLALRSDRGSTLAAGAHSQLGTTERGWVPESLYLWTLKFEFYITFKCHKILFSSVKIFPSHVILYKTFLAHGPYQNRLDLGPGQVAQLVRALSRYAEAAGSIPARAHTEVNG